MNRKRFKSIAMGVAVLLGGCSSSTSARPQLIHHTSRGDHPPIPGCFNRAWETAVAPFEGRYAGLTQEQVHDVRRAEVRFAGLLDTLTAVDGCGDEHGCYHITKNDKEKELWSLLQSLPPHPGEARLLLSAIDDVYLGYHWNGFWGNAWHWPYLSCVKAVALAERLMDRHPDQGEEALWTMVYCHRVMGWLEFDSGSGGVESDASTEQRFWVSSPDKARALCNELLRRFPMGRHANHAKRLLELEDAKLRVQLATSPVFDLRGMSADQLGEEKRRRLGLFWREGL
jgi:hypothetical protein